MGWTRKWAGRSKVFCLNVKSNVREYFEAGVIAGTMPGRGGQLTRGNGGIQHVAEVIFFGKKLEGTRTRGHPNLAVNPLCHRCSGKLIFAMWGSGNTGHDDSLSRFLEK